MPKLDIRQPEGVDYEPSLERGARDLRIHLEQGYDAHEWPEHDSDLPPQNVNQPAYAATGQAMPSLMVERVRARNGRSIGRQIEASAAEHGHEDDIQGLRLDMANGERYVVRDTAVAMERESVVKKAVRPRFVDDGRGGKTFKRPETEMRVKKTWKLRSTIEVGPLGHNTDGRTVTLERKRTGLNPKFKEVPTVVVEIYDDVGEVIGVKTMKRDKLYELAGEHGVRRAGWDDRRPETRVTGAMRVGLPDSINVEKKNQKPEHKQEPDALTAISSQLEAVGATNWEGLAWDQQDRRTGSSFTQEIILDDTVLEWGAREEDADRWDRTFVVRTTHRNAQGQAYRTIDEVMKDADLLHYFNSDSRKRGFVIGNMRYVRREEVRPEDAETPPAGRPPRRREGEENTWMEGAMSRPESDTSDEITLDEAYELLNYRQLYPMDKEEAQERFRERVEKLKRDGGEERYAREIQRTITEVGRTRFKEVVDEIQDTYLRDLHRLNLRSSVWELSKSSYIRELMKARMNRDETDPDPFADTMAGSFARRDIIDSKLGHKYKKTVTVLTKPAPVPTGEVDEKTGQPIHETRREFRFDDRMWPVFGIIDAGRAQIKKRRSEIWGNIETQARIVHKLNTDAPWDSEEGIPQDVKQEIERRCRTLGRMLRRTIGE